ncbi:NocE [Streptomyces sp. NPDC051840]|uniref:golvesin C-terminal-like domain-containing protein n=1 Tax=unclassified Streptomyces TaxID=2593676 RepID=UPI0034477010
MAATALLAGYPSLSMAKTPEPPAGAAQGWTEKDKADAADPGPAALPEAVPAKERAEVLGAGYRDSDDLAWTTSGDATGFHVMVAAADDGYRWRTAATLSEPGFDTDTWIGNACLTASGKRAAVTYAPRTFTNKPALMTRGAFTAIVDLTTGAVTKLPVQSSLSYFSPGCGATEKAVFSQFSDDDSKRNETRLIGVDTASGKAAKPLKLPGQVTSAVPLNDGYAAAQGARLVEVAPSGDVRVAARTTTVPFQLTAAGDGSVVYIDRIGTAPATAKAEKTAGERAEVRRAPAALFGGSRAAGATQRVATGALTDFDLARSARSGKVYVTGKAKASGSLPESVRMPAGVAKDAVLSTRGETAVTTAWADGKDSRITPQEAASARTARARMQVLDTGRTVTLDSHPGTTIGSTAKTASGLATSPALTGGGSATATPKLAAASPTNPVEDERYCSVPRGDVRKQAFQPTPRQVEWAVDQAVVGKLNSHVSRPANWKNTGMSAYQPQSLFPLKTMAGDPNGVPDAADEYHIPAQVMLGITAQESNMWQATRFAVPGVTANTLIGNYYGISYDSDGGQNDPWAVNWASADCGYGIVQVTDGMRKAGHEKPGETALSVQKQEAVALDYTANIAAGVNILVDKWNQTYAAGMTINDDGPSYIENWFFALWAYNSGFYPQSTAGQHGGHWGVGFTNNPANPLWKANRTPFLESAAGGDDYSHAAHPQDWPYQEKVIGWAARPISAMFAPGDFQPGYRAAWWTAADQRTLAKPPVGLFCDTSNNCDPSKIKEGDTGTNGACQLNNPADEFYLHCWWNKKASWKSCLGGACGYALHRFDATYPEQPDGNAYPPRCSSGLPSGTYVIDDVASGVTPAGSSGRSCGATTSPGTFGFTFTADGANYPGKIDTHQIGAGYGNHFWFSHTRNQATAEGARLRTTGTWTLTNGMTGWARVWVHLPDHGAHTRQASYTISGTNSTSPVRVHPQRVLENKWVSLGVFQFTSTPKISLSTHSADGTGSEDVAWDAAGFQPLSGKPKDMVVALGDSYSSGEGASASGGVDYYKETNYRDENNPSTRNACHRSTKAWSRQATIPGRSASVGSMDDSRSAAMDYHLVACSGARTYNIATVGENGELPQLQKGYLDQNTTLVTMSIGGNDARFAYIIQKCIFGGVGWPTLCQDQTFDDDDKNVDDAAYQGLKIGVAAERLAKERVRPAITTALKNIAAKAPNAKIVLMGYPPLLEGVGGCIPGVGTEEAPWLNSMAGTLATEMQGAVNDAKTAGVKAWFSNPAQNFAGKAVCGDPEQVHGIVLDLVESDEPAIDWPILQLGASAQSFHPKIGGARLYADSLERTMAGMGL